MDTRNCIPNEYTQFVYNYIYLSIYLFICSIQVSVSYQSWKLWRQLCSACCAWQRLWRVQRREPHPPSTSTWTPPRTDTGATPISPHKHSTTLILGEAKKSSLQEMKCIRQVGREEKAMQLLPHFLSCQLRPQTSAEQQTYFHTAWCGCNSACSKEICGKEQEADLKQTTYSPSGKELLCPFWLQCTVPESDIDKHCQQEPQQGKGYQDVAKDGQDFNVLLR